MKIDSHTSERLLSAIPDPIFIVDSNMLLTYMNPAAVALTESPPDDFIGTPYRTVFNTIADDSECVFQRCLTRNSTAERRRVSLLLPRGQRLEAILTAAPIFSPARTFEGGLAILRDLAQEPTSSADIAGMGRSSGADAEVSIELTAGLTECFEVLQEVRQGNLDARVSERALSSGDELLEKLCILLNDTIEEIQAQHVRVDEYHESSMELAMGLSECFQVLQEVRQGNLEARTSQTVLDSNDELLASFAKALNDTTNELQEHIETIRQQQFAIRELSTPILQLWENVLALPVIGTVDTKRSAEIMELLLAKITETQCLYVILDITGVEVVDTKTADHFIKVVKAAELLGTTCVLTGMRPAVAQTLVDIGVDLSAIRTLRNLKEGLRECRRLMEGQPTGGGARPGNRE